MSSTANDTTTTNNSGTGNSDGGTSGVTDKVRESADAASRRAAEAYNAARERTTALYGTARERASTAGQRTSQRIETNPMAAVVGGLALGGLVAWLLPKTERESQALGSVGTKLTDTARQAAQSAMDAGKEQVNQIKESAASNIGHAVMDAVSSSTGSGGGSGTTGQQ